MIDLDRLVVTSGSQAALFAVISTLMSPGAVLATPAVTYPGLRSVAARCGVRLLPVASDEQGLIPEDLDRLCRIALPEALYCVPTLDNPTTATLSLLRREGLAAIARRHDIAIIEDDAYAALPEAAPAPIAALAPERTWHIATLSKCATPALRLAYVVAPNLAGALQVTAQTRVTNLMAPPLMAGLATIWIKDGTMARLTASIRRENRARQAIAATALRGLQLPHRSGGASSLACLARSLGRGRLQRRRPQGRSRRGRQRGIRRRRATAGTADFARCRGQPGRLTTGSQHPRRHPLRATARGAGHCMILRKRVGWYVTAAAI